MMVEETRVVGDEGAVFLLDADLDVPAPAVLFDASFWERSGYIRPAAKGRGMAMFIGDDSRRWVWRHFRRGGLIGRLVKETYVYTSEFRVRSFAEWRLLARLVDMGLPVPAPIAACYCRRGLFYTADIITRELDDAVSLSQRLEGKWPEPRLWTEVGACVRRFHDAGVYHSDLNAHNILLREGHPQREAPEVFLIDFDKGRLRGAGKWTQRNLDRLHRSLVKISDARKPVESAWQDLLAGYHGLQEAR